MWPLVLTNTAGTFINSVNCKYKYKVLWQHWLTTLITKTSQDSQDSSDIITTFEQVDTLRSLLLRDKLSSRVKLWRFLDNLDTPRGHPALQWSALKHTTILLVIFNYQMVNGRQMRPNGNKNKLYLKSPGDSLTVMLQNLISADIII